MKRKEFYLTALMAAFLIAGPALFAQGNQEKDEGNGQPRLQSSLTVPDKGNDKEESGAKEESAELDGIRSRLLPLDQAYQKAEENTAAGNWLTGITLEVRNGNVVYKTEYSDSTVAILDGGNGEVLYKGKSLEEEDNRDYNEEN